jgi:uncharacterized membrane protein
MDAMTWVALFSAFGAGWLAFAARSRALRAEAEARRVSERLAYTENYVAWIDRELIRLKDARSAATAARSTPQPQPAPQPQQDVTPAAQWVPPPDVPIAAISTLAQPEPEPEPTAPQPISAAQSAPSAPAPPAPPIPTSDFSAPSFDWENLIGVRLFAWLGGGTLFLGAALFLHYSIQQNLISPTLRVANGLVVGAAALFGGDQLRQRTRMAAEAISGAGVAILYASLFAAHSLYHLLDATPTFAGMALVTVTGGLMAVRRGAFLVAVLGLIGGMATPYLLSTGEDRPVALFVYVLLLDAGVLAVARKRDWPVLALLGFIGSSVLCVGWAVRYLDAARAGYALGAVALVAALFAFVQLSPRDRSEPAKALPRAITLISALAPFVAAFTIGGSHSFQLQPWLLAGYLIVISGGAWLAGFRVDTPALMPFAAGLSVLALTCRPDTFLFPEHRSATLACFALAPLAYLVAWFLRRERHDARTLRFAATIALCGSLAVILRVVGLEPNDAPKFGIWLYAAAHAAGLVALGGISGASVLVALGQALNYASLLLLCVLPQDSRLTELTPSIAFSGLVFWSLPLLLPIFRRDRLAWLTSAVSLPAQFLLLYWGEHAHWGSLPLGGSAVLCAALELFSLNLARQHSKGEPEQALALSAVFGGLVLLFITSAIPILLDNEWLTLTWALEVAALAWLKRRIPHRGLALASALLAGAVCVRLLVNPALWDYHERTALPIFNFYLYTFGLPTVAFLVAAWLFDSDVHAARYHLPRALRIAATVFLFFLLNVEIADFYSEGSTITFHFSGGGLAQDMTYSLAWGLFGLGLMTVGIVLRQKAPRIGALGVLILTMGKVFFHDLWELGALYRVASVIGMAVTLLLFSYLSQRFILQKDAP